MFAFCPLYNLWNTVMLGQLLYSCRGLEQLPNFILALSIHLRVPLMWSLWLVSLPLRHCHSWHHNHFLIYVKSLPHRVPLAAHLDSLAWWAMSTFPWSAKPSTSPFMFDLEFNSSIITSFLCRTFIFVVQFFLSITRFYKMSLRFITGKVATGSAACWRTEWQVHSDQSLMGFKRSEMAGHWSKCTPAIYAVVQELKS